VSGAAPRLDEPGATKNGVDDDSYASRAHRREKLTVTKSGVVDVDVEANGRFSAGQDLGELMLPVSLELKDWKSRQRNVGKHSFVEGSLLVVTGDLLLGFVEEAW